MSSEDQRDKLKQHFSKRVTSQARIVLDNWQKLKDSDWADMQWLNDLKESAEKLGKFASRFEMNQHLLVAKDLTNVLDSIQSDETQLDDLKKEKINKAITALSECTQRKSDCDASAAPRTFLRTPIYIAINHKENAQRIIKQLEFFGFRAISFDTSDELIKAAQHNKPETIVIDVDFNGDKFAGIETIKSIQSNHETPIPIIYTSEDDDGIEIRLMASRSGGEEFFHKVVDLGQLIEKIEEYTNASPLDPYKVLVVDDSRAQARYIENVLTKAGMTTCVITDPMQVLIALNDFSPEIVIMDMYMPGCTGMELARVIRQQDKFHSVPIIYLSAEDDINKQLHAMSLGGDDFLTKPINPKHLASTIHNRGRRARSLLALMIRDSLTGLYNHTHTLYLLENEIAKAHQNGTKLTFAMLDIDFFKKINDSYGHPIGDRVLKSLSLFLKQRLRKTDHIGRYGGEEFAIVLPNTSENDAKIILNEIREKFAELQQPAGNSEFHVTFSCGVASGTHENAQLICERADNALYDAKRAGRNAVRSYREPSSQ
ncbi:GGDEF domain-containing response regulator [Alkalimarinus alittae]|uniref:diguanylate cyclase n=1 Tax=Alkalimarinus alittae TaxID=2961619 RepID=A0ABY6N3Q2_9ALTE|nr:diguanylate cyclase [Alkalimarinus alittae]UZE96721.1 diguanylate cyclase [Alkalimarinus alittae]